MMSHTIKERKKIYMSKINRKNIICVDLNNIRKSNIRKLSDIIGYSPEQISHFKKEGASKVFFDYEEKVAIAVIDKKAKTTESYKGLILINTNYYNISKKEKDTLLNMSDNLDMFYEKEYTKESFFQDIFSEEVMNEGGKNINDMIENFSRLLTSDISGEKLEQMLFAAQEYLEKIDESIGDPNLQEKHALEYINKIKKISKGESTQKESPLDSLKTIEERLESMLGGKINFKLSVEEEEVYDLDEILEKIHEHGKESLTEGELKFLNNIK